MSPRRNPLTIAALTLASAAFAGQNTEAAATSGCDRVAAPGGSDAMSGTEAQPLRSAEALVASLAPGQTGCLRSGTYGAGEQLRLRTPGITLTSFPGERATVQGRVRVETSADGATIAGLNLNGRNPENLLSPLIYADRFVLRGNDITNHHTAICVHVDSYRDDPAPQGVVISGNRIHDCGRLPATNHSHGVYIANARGTIIRDNLIYANADRGVQLYPNADGSIVTGNVIHGNGQGVIFGGGRTSASDNNLVAENVITASNIRYNIESHWQGPTGTGNVARDNCVWSTQATHLGSPVNSGILKTRNGFEAPGNVIAAPRYADPAAGDFRLQTTSPCARILPSLATSAGPPSADPPDSMQDARVELEGSASRRRVSLSGRVVGAPEGSDPIPVTIERKRDGRWRPVATVRADRRQQFRARIRHRRGRVVRTRAHAEGVGRSAPLRIRVPRRGTWN